MKTMGTIEVTICIRLDQDITVEQAREFVNELDYSITAPENSPVYISHTEVISDNIAD